MIINCVSLREHRQLEIRRKIYKLCITGGKFNSLEPTANFEPKSAKAFGNTGEVVLNGLKQYVNEVKL